ncbi:hypothetical protein GGS26DRAFT_591425 [Hypomontagnella submonticulosa]|nr:hypothetical protein GGS26DRAFT_591425 [Hypomontagnella submonticulosa]
MLPSMLLDNDFIWPHIETIRNMALRKMIGTRLSMPKDAAHDLYAVAPRDVTASGDKSFQGTDLWSEVSFFVMAGGIMVSTLMSAVFFYLTRHTDMYTRLATEIRTTFISGEAVAFVPFALGDRARAGKAMAYLESGLTIAKTL